MKKIYLSALALMIGAIGFAQNNTETTTQDGTGLVNKVEQAGMDNVATVDQDGYTHEAYIKQTGKRNAATQIQNDANTQPKIGTAHIDQKGNDNIAYQNQKHFGDGTVRSTQIGNRNRSYQYNYSGHGNDMVVYQGNPADDNYAKQEVAGTNNFMEAKQSGNRNESFQQQTSSLHGLAKVNQSGNDNDAYQTQTGGAYNSVGELLIKQSGNGNLAVQDQMTPGVDEDGNFASIDQQGNLGEARQYQYGNGGMATILQRGGSSNYGFQSQDAASTIADAKLTQTGNSNWSQQWQYGDANESNVNQNGNDMWSHVTQHGVGNSNTVIQTN